MNLDKIKQKKIELQEAVAELISRFEEETNVKACLVLEVEKVEAKKVKSIEVEYRPAEWENYYCFATHENKMSVLDSGFTITSPSGGVKYIIFAPSIGEAILVNKVNNKLEEITFLRR